jgi:hypothetical protein
MIDVHPPGPERRTAAAADRHRRRGRPGNGNSSRVAITLKPGRCTLKQPITLGQQHSNLTLRGSPEATTLSAAPSFEKAFGQGLIVLVGASNVTITGLELELPQVPAALPKVRESQQQHKTFAAAVNAVAANRHVSFGIRPVHCAAPTIGDCLFRFTPGTQVTAPGAAPAPPGAVFGAGVFAAAEVIANRVSSTGTAPAAALLGVTNQTITGNLITAANAKTTSLVVAASPHVAITGNVITGTPLLPANRPFPAFDSWPPLNSVI